jgi:hypothetical protein
MRRVTIRVGLFFDQKTLLPLYSYARHHCEAGQVQTPLITGTQLLYVWFCLPAGQHYRLIFERFKFLIVTVVAQKILSTFDGLFINDQGSACFITLVDIDLSWTLLLVRPLNIIANFTSAHLDAAILALADDGIGLVEGWDHICQGSF